MAIKRVVRKRETDEFQKIEREIEGEVKDVEKWVIERRKFFIKLGIIVIFLILIILYARFF